LTTLYFFELTPAIGFLWINQKKNIYKKLGWEVSATSTTGSKASQASSTSQRD
jgi:hypothetical protein